MKEIKNIKDAFYRLDNQSITLSEAMEFYESYSENTYTAPQKKYCQCERKKPSPSHKVILYPHKNDFEDYDRDFAYCLREEIEYYQDLEHFSVIRLPENLNGLTEESDYFFDKISNSQPAKIYFRSSVEQNYPILKFLQNNGILAEQNVSVSNFVRNWFDYFIGCLPQIAGREIETVSKYDFLDKERKKQLFDKYSDLYRHVFIKSYEKKFSSIVPEKCDCEFDTDKLIIANVLNFSTLYDADDLQFIPEFRIFVVNGNFKSISPYENYEKFLPENMIFEATDFADKVIKYVTEHIGFKNYTLDVAFIECDNAYRKPIIVEFNDLSSSGRYYNNDKNFFE